MSGMRRVKPMIGGALSRQSGVEVFSVQLWGCFAAVGTGRLDCLTVLGIWLFEEMLNINLVLLPRST